MSTEGQDERPAGGRPLRPQFSLRSMFVLVAVVSVVLAVMFTLPDTPAGFVLLFTSFALPAGLTVVVIYGSGYLRTICIGSLFPAGTLLFGLGLLWGIMLVNDGPPTPDHLIELAQGMGQEGRAFVGFTWVLSLLTGLVAVGLRRLVERRGA
jgi:hypothetical protein